MKISIIFIIVLYVCCVQDAEAVCGYEACPTTKDGMINVHLVPHSHDDVGWLKTVDQYYYGANNTIQHAGVQYILDSVVKELLKDKNRRFIYVESAFFFKWYDEQPIEVQNSVKMLVDEGRLEFVGGAWSMNDEAAVHYQSVIDQFSIGLKALNETFGTCGRPRVGWQIDPFGHSRDMAAIFSQMGYDGEFFARIDWVEKNARLNNKTAEMVWIPTDVLSDVGDIFTGLLYNHYSAPPGFCFDYLCSDAPIVDDDEDIYANNVKAKVDAFIKYIEQMSTHYRTPHLLVPMGDDFNYENAAINFKNMDKLIKYVNERQATGSNITVFYSTPACYVNSLHKLAQTWPNKTQDFFPYSTDWHTYWTGYYSSRPTQKRFERDANHLLQIVRQLTVLANLTDSTSINDLNILKEAMGVMQHHDAITGTEKQHVAADYDRILHEGVVAAANTGRTALRKLTNLTNGEFEVCMLYNISACPGTINGANNLVVTLYNPISHSTYQTIRIPAKNESYYVIDAYGREMKSQLLEVPEEVLALPFRENHTQHELVFYAFAEKVSSYYVRVSPTPREPYRPPNIPDNQICDREPEIGDTIVQTSLVKLTFDRTGHLAYVQMNGLNEPIRQEFYYYKGANGNNAEFQNRSSGAYIFRPNGTEVLINSIVKLKVYDGPIVKEVHQHFNEWISQVVRIYEGINRIEFEWLIGPIPIADNIGKEVITRFSSNLNNRGVFYTDSNGREMLRRVVNEREYFKPNVTEKISSNYYPVTTRIALEDNFRRIALLNDRAQGGSSTKPGSLELMLHRRLLRDDAFGVGEALNETAFGQGLIARGKVFFLLSKSQNKPSVEERLAQVEIHLPFYKFLSNASQATNKTVSKIPSFSSLPYNVQVLTLEPYGDDRKLLRLEHILDHGTAASTIFSLRELFNNLGGQEIIETTLDGNMYLRDMKRFKFHIDGSNSTDIQYQTVNYKPLYATRDSHENDFSVSLDPLQIRTFLIRWK